MGHDWETNPIFLVHGAMPAGLKILFLFHVELLFLHSLFHSMIYLSIFIPIDAALIAEDCIGYAKFKMPSRQPRRDVRQKAGKRAWNLQERGQS